MLVLMCKGFQPTSFRFSLFSLRRHVLRCVSLQLTGLKDTLGSLRFIEKCADHGAGRMEHLLRDYHNAQEELRTLKYSILKDKLISAESSRAAQLQWLGEFMVFVGSHHSALAAYPNLTFQYAINQVRRVVVFRGFAQC